MMHHCTLLYRIPFLIFLSYYMGSPTSSPYRLPPLRLPRAAVIQQGRQKGPSGRAGAAGPQVQRKVARVRKLPDAQSGGTVSHPIEIVIIRATSGATLRSEITYVARVCKFQGFRIPLVKP
jgi:hypothetical protein